MDPSSLPLNEKVDSAVKNYADVILEYAKKLNPTIEVEMVDDLTTDQENTCSASIIDIQSEYAMITIFPDFNKQSALASMLNKGLIISMDLEGFDDETISNSPIYSGLLPFSVDNAEIFAILLTEDLEIQHQKNLY